MAIIPNAKLPQPDAPIPPDVADPGHYRFGGWQIADIADVGAKPASPNPMINVDAPTGFIVWNQRTISQPAYWGTRVAVTRNLRLVNP